MSESQSQPPKQKKLLKRPTTTGVDISKILDIPVSQIPVTPVTIAPVVNTSASVPSTATTNSTADKKLKLAKKSVGNAQEAGVEESIASVMLNAVEKKPHTDNNAGKFLTQPSLAEEKPPLMIGRQAISVMESSTNTPTSQVTGEAKSNQENSLEITPDLISYFLDKDVPFELEDDGLFGFNSRVLLFLSRNYDISGGAGKEIYRNQNKHAGSRPNNNKSGNTFPTGDPTFQRMDSKKSNNPSLNKQNSNQNNFKSNNQGSETTMKRQEEDKDITDLKLKIKQSSAQFLEKKRQEKQDTFKKQISDIRMNLNILTPTNFEKIKHELFELSMLDPTLCEYVVEGIIEKARTQKTYSQMYADLCKYIINESKKIYPSVDLDENGKPVDKRGRMFKDHLYSNIQDTFEGEKDVYNNKMTFAKHKHLSDLKTSDEKMMYFMDKKKREMLNVQFIGNLFLNHSMSIGILNLCCSFLARSFFHGLCSIPEDQRDSNEVEEAHYEDHIEALVALFEQTGPKMLEKHTKSTKKADNTELVNAFTLKVIETNILSEEQAKFLEETQQFNYDDYFTIFEWLKKEKKVSPRLYSLLVNLIERKNEDWRDRLGASSGPLSKQDLQKQHEQELQQQQKELAQYEQDNKNNKGGRGGKHGNKFEDKNNRNSRQQQKYVPVNGKNNKGDNGAADSKLSQETTNNRIKEIWTGLDQRTKAGENGVDQAVEDIKKLSTEATPAVFGEALLRTLYDCNVQQKPNRLAVAKIIAETIKPEDFTKAFNLRMDKCKDESSDFPMFLSFLTTVYYHLYVKGTVKYNTLKITYKPEYDEDCKFDLMFVYKNFFEDTIDLIKADTEAKVTIAAFLDEEVSPVMSKEDEQYEKWANGLKK